MSEQDFITQNLKSYLEKPHNYIDYKNKVCVKPWGYEFLCYESLETGIWYLNICCNMGTSLHTHLEKDTIIVIIEGMIELQLFNSKKTLLPGDVYFIPRKKFHALKAMINNSKLLEIEVYTENVQFSDKNDLIRHSDTLKRYDNIYKNSIELHENLADYDYFILNGNPYKKENIVINILNNKNEIKFDRNTINILVNGKIFAENKYLSCGTILSDSNFENFTDEIKILSITIEDLVENNKVLVSDCHIDYILSKNIGKKIVLTSGCYDIFHKGHIKILKESKKLGDLLIVCLSSDKQISYLKGEKRPINCLHDRIMLLKSLDMIDYIIPYDEENYTQEKTLDNLIIKINPYFWVKGADYNIQNILDLHPSIKNIKLIELEDTSTTKIVKKILK